MPYITDAAREYAKKLAKDKSKYQLISKEEEKKINDIAAKYEFEADLMKDDNTKIIVLGTNKDHLNDITNDIKALSDKYVISKFKDGHEIGKDTFVSCVVRKIADSCMKDDEDIVESFINMIDAFDELHHDELAILFKQHDVDEFTGPTIGSKLLRRYVELLK